jgi:hypothetical protein
MILNRLVLNLRQEGLLYGDSEENEQYFIG